MAAIDGRVLGARVREARERAGRSQGDLARDVGLDRTAINKIEAGHRKVTAIELSDIAQALQVRMSSFFEAPLPALVSHRSSTGADVVDSQIDQLLADLATDVEFVQSLAPETLNAYQAPEPPYPPPTTPGQADQMARAARRLLELDDREPVPDLIERVARVGLYAFSIDLGGDTADAGTILLRKGAAALVNSHSRVGRRRLALAHELGHYLIADDYTIDWRIDSEQGQLETHLDRFARAVLLPENGAQAAWRRRRESHGLREAAVLVASEFRVDMATLARRLTDLGLVDADTGEAIRRSRTTRADIVDFGLQIPHDLEAASVPRPYAQAVLRAYRDERLSRERALDLLRGTFDEDDLPTPRQRREDELWTFVS